jgi:hypothetical protein
MWFGPQNVEKRRELDLAHVTMRFACRWFAMLTERNPPRNSPQYRRVGARHP